MAAFPPASETRWRDPSAPAWVYSFYPDGTVVIREPLEHAGKSLSGSARAAVISRYTGTGSAETAQETSGSILSTLAQVAGGTGTPIGTSAASVLSTFESGGVKAGSIAAASALLTHGPGLVMDAAEKKAAKKGDVNYLKSKLTKYVTKYYKTKSASKRAKLKAKIDALATMIRALGGSTRTTVPAAPPRARPSSGMGLPTGLLVGGAVLGLLVVGVLLSRRKR